ncbi:MAG: T9SS type A sorting domain-containing protein [Endomicrobiales bacterium]|nr:T9SS type A sorting domain-containing protein [Endomicrobiales bacterium]
MKRLYYYILVAGILLIPSLSFSTPPTPHFQALKNYNGDLAIFWNINDATPTDSTDFYIYISTADITGTSYDEYAELESATFVNKLVVPYSGDSDMYVFYTEATENVRYYVSLLAYDYADAVGNKYSIVDGPRSATPVSGALSITSITSTVDGVNTYYVDYDSQTVIMQLVIEGEGEGFTGQTNLWMDIRTQVNDTSIMFGGARTQLPMTIAFSSTSFSATAIYTWDCACYNHGGGEHKHNGGYFFYIYPSLDAANDEYIAAKFVELDVTHINPDNKYFQQLGSDAVELHYGPPFRFNYYLSKDAFVTWKIWDRNQTIDNSDDTLVRIVVSSAPRWGGDSSKAPGDWDKNIQIETWDGRDQNGEIVSNDIYRFSFCASEFWEESGSSFDPDTTDMHEINGTIAFDVLRLINVTSEGISDEDPLAHFKYTLAGANESMGGAKIKIVICSPGTTFYMTPSSGTATYLSGGATYYYDIGDPMPYNPNRIKKIFSFYRTSGEQDETWNGYDDAGASLPNNNYVFAMSATDDSGNSAVDNAGNDRIIIGNITIDRTASQEAGDSDPPEITSISVGNTSINLTGTPSTLSQPFTSVSVTLTDSGGSGVDLNNTSISLTAPNGASIAATATSNNNTDTITLTYTQQSTNGSYSVRITPRDTAGNTASETIITFTLSITQAGVEAAFEDSIYVYPNPAKGVNSMTFVYDMNSVTSMKLEIFNTLGELIYKDEWTSAGIGQENRSWNIVNDSNNKIATGVYLYRITAEGVSSTKKLNKLVVVQ